MSDSSLQSTVLRLEAQLADLQQRFDILENERLVYNLIQDYALYHDRCFGKCGTVEDDAKWELLFTEDSVSDWHPLGVHHGRSGKMSWAQTLLGGRGKGSRVSLSNVRVIVKDASSTSATAQSYAEVTVVPDDETRTITVKGQYDWKFEKVDGVWKVAVVTLSPFPKP